MTPIFIFHFNKFGFVGLFLFYFFGILNIVAPLIGSCMIFPSMVLVSFFYFV